MKRRSFCCLVLLALAVASTALWTEAQTPAADRQGVQITQLTNRLRVEINGQLFTEYCFKNVPRPYCYPLIGPGGAAMTRSWPMADVPNEEHDHPNEPIPAFDLEVQITPEKAEARFGNSIQLESDPRALSEYRQELRGLQTER